MEYAIPVLLTFIAVLGIIKIAEKYRWKDFNKISYSQSYMHYRLRSFIPKNTTVREKIPSQIDQHIQKNMVKIVVIDGSAYWVADNIFYVADMQNGSVLSDTVRQIDTVNMSKEELDKMLVILDNLKDGGE